MAIKTITLLDGTTAYAHDVEDLVNPLYTDIDDTNIRLGAAIQIKKLEASTNVADIIVGNASKVPTYVAMSGDATISATGVLTVTSGIANKLTITNDITTDAIMYPVWVNASTGNLTPYVSTEFKFNPHNASYSNVATLTTDRFIGALTGNADTSTTASNLANGTYSYGSGAIIVDARNCSGNAATVTNGVYTTGSYSDPSWITSLAGSKIAGLDWSTCWVGGDSVHNHTSIAEGGVIHFVPSTIVKLTSGSGNWTVPAGVTRVKVIVVGGGGGGGGGFGPRGSNPGDGRCGGGGGGGTLISNAMAQIVSVTPGDTIAYSVGTGGAGGNGGWTPPDNPTDGSDGTASTFGAITSGYGLGGGYNGLGGAGPSSYGSAGCNGVYPGDNEGLPGHGGAGGGAGGKGGEGATSPGTATAGSTGRYGGGGGGGGTVEAGAGADGGAGGSGIIIIEY